MCENIYYLMCFHGRWKCKIVPIDNLDTCAICFEKMYKNLYIFDCGHTFHMICALTWVNTKQTCPLCRNVETRENILNTVIKRIS